MMKPHPSTPTPRRFLTKRPASSQLPPHSTPTPMRFQSTPRFVGSSTQSATRQQMEDVVEEEADDVGASQSQSSSSSSANERRRPRSERRDIALLDSIEVDSCADSLTSREEPPSSSRSSRSSSSGHEMDEDGDERRPRGGYVGDGDGVGENGVATDDVHAELVYGDGEEEEEEEEGTPKPVKRRRLLSASASPTELHMVVVAAAPYDSDAGGHHHHEQDDDSEQDDDGDDGEDDDDDDDDVQDKTTRTRVPAQQPTFQPAPRFKPAAPEDEPFFASGGQVCTATAAPCSPPPRRGAAKYLAGGLASQLQGLLSKVKGVVEAGNNDDGGGGGGATGAVARVLVEEVRLGARMHLVRGRVLSRGPVAAAAAESDEVVVAAAQCYMLAGGGGGGADARMVKEGSVLRIMPAPAWNVHLGEEEWTVACDWSVESLEI